jgi:hypothetical protein
MCSFRNMNWRTVEQDPSAPMRKSKLTVRALEPELGFTDDDLSSSPGVVPAVGFSSATCVEFRLFISDFPFQVTVSKVATFLSKSHEDSRWLKKGLAVGFFIKANITCFVIFSLGRVCMHFFDQHYYQNVRKNRPDLLVLEGHTPLEYSSGFHCVLHMDHSGIDGSRVGQDLFEEARHASAFDGPYASFRKSQGDDCNVETRIWISVVGILEDGHRSAV